MSQSGDGFDFSLIRGGPLYGVLRALHLVTSDGLAVQRRIAIFAAVAWLPVVGGALAIGRAYGSETPEPLWRHFAVHARCLIGIPLFVAAELIAERWVPVLVRYFVESGLVRAEDHGAFREALRATAQLRDSGWGQIFVIGSAVLAVIGNLSAPLFAHEITWAVIEPEGGRVAFPGLWYLLISRPLFLILMLVWIWRIVVLCVLFRRIAQLDLQLVAIHPDRSAGLGFLDVIPQVAAPVVFALSAVLASEFAHEVLYHGARVASFRSIIIAWGALAIAALLLPLLPFCFLLARMRRISRLRYGNLLGEHGRLFDARWFTGGRSNEKLLGVQDIGAATDALTLYRSVETLRPAPFGLRSVIPLAVAALLPMLPVLSIEIPVKDLVLRIAKALI